MLSVGEHRLERALALLATVLAPVGAALWVGGRQTNDAGMILAGKYALAIGAGSLAIHLLLSVFSADWRKLWVERLVNWKDSFAGLLGTLRSRLTVELASTPRLHLEIVTRPNDDELYIGTSEVEWEGVEYSDLFVMLKVRVKNVDVHQVEIDAVSAEFYEGRKKLHLEPIRELISLPVSDDPVDLPAAIPARSHKDLDLCLRYRIKNKVKLSRSQHRLLLRLVTPLGNASTIVPAELYSE